jgi:acetyl-CoA C-acetyltransferase
MRAYSNWQWHLDEAFVNIDDNPARIVALNVGLSESVAGLTIDRQCSGGLDAITLADALIRSGSHQVVIAGGVESYS